MSLYGVQFLKTLNKHISENEESINKGTARLSLTPIEIKFLHHVLEAFDKGEVEPDIAKKIPHDVLVDIKYFISQITHLKIEAPERTTEKRTEMDLQYFKSIQKFELNRCKPYLLVNLNELSLKLTMLGVHDVLNSLSELIDIDTDFHKLLVVEDQSSETLPISPYHLPHLSDTDTKAQTKQLPWKQLTELNCSHNNIPALDKSMKYLVGITKADFSHNLITKIENCEYCYNLWYLDLSFNQITSLQAINTLLGNVKTLLLSANKIVSTEGLERLYCLQVLDLSGNLISSMEEVLRLKKLPLIEKVFFAGNPVVYHPNYRKIVFANYKDGLVLDGARALLSEKPIDEHILAKPLATMSPSRVEGTHLDLEPSVTTITPPMVPLKKKKKHKNKQRVVTIEEMPRKKESGSLTPQMSSLSLHEHKEERKAEKEVVGVDDERRNSTEEGLFQSDFFQSKIEEIRKEGGSQWLVILNEMLQDHQKEREDLLQKEKERRKEIRDKNRKTRQRTEEEKEELEKLIEAETKHTATNIGVPHEENEVVHPESPLSSEEKNGLHPQTEEHFQDNQEKESFSPLTSPTLEEENKLEDQEKKDVIESEQESELMTSHNVPSKPTPIGSSHTQFANEDDDQEHSTEEFYVETFAEKESALAGGEERILVISLHTQSMLEADVITGVNVLNLQLRHLVRVEDVSYRFITNSKTKPIVELEFRTSLLDRNQRNVCLYQMESQESRDHLFKLLEPTLRQNKRERKIRCVSCSAVYDLPDAELNNCSRCNSPYIVEFEATDNSPVSQSPSKHITTEKSVSVTHPADGQTAKRSDLINNLSDSDDESVVDDTTSNADDMNMQLYLRLNFFQGGRDENYITLIRTNFIQLGRNEEERPCLILLTSIHIYVLVQQRKPTDKDKGLGLVSVHKLRELKRVVVGLFQQAFRFEFAESNLSSAISVPYAFTTRDHTLTSEFLDTLHKVIKSCDDIFDPPATVYKNQQHIENITRSLLSPSPTSNYARPVNINIAPDKPFQIHLYILAYQVQKNYTWKGFHPIMGEGGNLVPRTIIVTEDQVLLCEEDYSKWAIVTNNPNYSASLKPSTQLLQCHNISDIVQIEIVKGSAPLIRIIFEEEAQALSSTKNLMSLRRLTMPKALQAPTQDIWEITTQAKLERSKLLQVLTKKWKDLFKLDLTVTTIKKS